MKFKKIMKTVDVLNKYNDWRTGAEIPQPSPKKLTKHITRAIIMLLQYAGELERAEIEKNFENSVIVPKEEKPKFYVGQTVIGVSSGYEYTIMDIHKYNGKLYYRVKNQYIDIEVAENQIKEIKDRPIFNTADTTDQPC